MHIAAHFTHFARFARYAVCGIIVRALLGCFYYWRINELPRVWQRNRPTYSPVSQLRHAARAPARPDTTHAQNQAAAPGLAQIATTLAYCVASHRLCRLDGNYGGRINHSWILRWN